MLGDVIMSLSENYVVDLPNKLRYQACIQTTWFACDGEKWEFISSITIDGIFIDEYRFSNICVNDMSTSITNSDLTISAGDCRCLAKSLCDYILKLAKETYPSQTAHESYYGDGV
jgi:hypothetical protein